MQNQITHLTGAQRVRLRPAVVFGDDGIEGAECALEMLLCVMASECYRGFASRLSLTAYKDGSFELRDNGRGLYLGSGKPEEDAIWKSKLCELYSRSAYPDQIDKDTEYSYFEESGRTPCRPYDSELYDEIWLCAVQYASEFMDVAVCRDGLLLELHFEKGENIGGICSKPLTAPSGTAIRFKPDREVFSCIDIPEDFLVDQLKKLAVLSPNCTVVYRKEHADGIQEETFCYPNGIAGEVEEQCAHTVATEIFTAEKKAIGKDRYDRPEYGAKIQLALCFTKDCGSIRVYHNRRTLIRGGQHLERLLAEIMKRLEWQLDCQLDPQLLTQHLCLTLNTTTTHYGSAWGDGSRTWINNAMICDMAQDCVKEAFSHYIKLHLEDIKHFIGIPAVE